MAATKEKTVYRVTGPYVTVPTQTEFGRMIVGLNTGGIVPADAPEWWVEHHLANGLIEAETPPPEPEPEPPPEKSEDKAPEDKAEDKAEPPKPGGPARSTSAPRTRGG